MATKFKGIEGLSPQQIEREIEQGGKFVIYQYCVSLVYITMKRASPIYFVKSTESRLAKGLSFTLLSLVMGWWGIPMGPIYTVMAITNNCKGGKDVTGVVRPYLLKAASPGAAQIQSGSMATGQGASGPNASWEASPGLSSGANPWSS